MIQSILFDSLPQTVRIGETAYPVNYGYRAMMAVEIEMFGDNNDEQKLLNALNLFYFQNIPSDWQKAVDWMLWFHRGGEKEANGEGKLRRHKRGYCFRQDAPLIYAAFRQQYQIDLRRTLNMDLHWWEFLAMFEALDDRTKMAKVMYWRTCDLGGLSKNEAKFIKKMRSLYALKEPAGTMDSRTKLAKRNADMKDYVRRRMEACRKK